jgi:iron complex outermembrane receptor protein
VGPLRIETPNVFLDPTSLSTALATAFAQSLQDPANAQLAAAVAALDAPTLGGNGNGSAVDELTTTFTANAAKIPYGTITAEQASDPVAVMLTYRNFGRVTIYGADLAFAYYPDDAWTITGNFSYVSEDLFPNLDNIGDIALNAPTQKFSIGLQYKMPNTGLTLGGNARYRGEFPMSSGVYVGSVDSYTVVDLNATYAVPLDQARLTFNVDASNILDQKYRSFVGAPKIGRLVSAGLAIRF